MNFIAGGVSLGLMIKVIGMLREWLKEKKDDKLKTCERLEGYLQEHSRDLVNEVLKKWFEPKSKESFIYTARQYRYDTPLANAYFEPHFRSRIENPSEPYYLKYADQAIQHLGKKEYVDVWAIWLECKRLVKNHLEKVVKIWEDIEKKLLTDVPAQFTEWDDRGISPSACYILGSTVLEIYREAEHLSRTGKFEETFFKRDDTEKGYFRVGTGTLYAKSSDESLGNEFISVAHSIIKDGRLHEQLKTLDAEQEKIACLVKKAKQAFDKIVDNFEKGHINLKGTCGRCNDWYNELIRLS